MTIQVKHELTKSLNPDKYEMDIRGKTGDIIQMLNDGYCLIEFHDLLLKVVYKEKKRKLFKLAKLQWYVHEQDFVIHQTKTYTSNIMKESEVF